MLTVTAIFGGTAFASSEVLGDVNGDGRLDVLDVVLTRAHIVGNAVLEETSADINGDSRIDILDVVFMRSYIVNADETPSETPVIPDTDSDEDTEPQVIMTLDPVKAPGDCSKLIKVKADYTSVYNANHKSSFVAPIYSQIPKDTLEYFASENGEYIISESGRKYKSDAVEVVSGNNFGENKIVVKSIEEKDGATILKIKTDLKTAFNIQPKDLDYKYIDNYDFFYTIDSFNPTRITIVFDNATAVTELPNFSGSDLFTKAEWGKTTDNGVEKFMLTLTLRQAGIYNGQRAVYDSDGNLVVTFTKYPSSIKEATIVIDPGHGYNDPGALGYLNGVRVNESDINAAIAAKLAEKLKAAGASVYVLPTSTASYSHKVRAFMARKYNPQIFISVHSNSSGSSSSPRGSMAFYHTQASQPLARAVVDKVSEVVGNKRSEDCLQDAYSVTLQNDFVSMLLETAFMSNSGDLAILTNPQKQDEIAAAITEGIGEYCARKR